MNNALKDLTAEYQNWCKANGYPEMSADELLHELQMTEGTEAHESHEEYLVTGDNRTWLKDFIRRWEYAETHTDAAAPTKFYYSEATATLYFLEDKQLCGMPQYQDGSFNMEESFVVEEYNKELGEESAGDTTLAAVWAAARKALS